MQSIPIVMVVTGDRLLVMCRTFDAFKPAALPVFTAHMQMGLSRNSEGWSEGMGGRQRRPAWASSS